MRSVPYILLLVLACAIAGTLLDGNRSDTPLDGRDDLYYENGTSGRAIATVRTDLSRRGSREACLDLAIRATGPFVDPVPGFEGIRGANRITARELDDITRGRRISIATKSADGTAVHGSWRAGARGRIPQRKLVRGKVVWNGWSDREYVIELLLSSGNVGPGRHEMTVVVDRRDRLRVRFTFDGNRGTIDSIESLDEHPLREAGQ